jgi:hypothetical protein
MNILFFLILILLSGFLYIEYKNWKYRDTPLEHKPERRRVRKIRELEQLGVTLLEETERQLNSEKMQTRSGLKFIMKMMAELYQAELQRTLKINELVEQFEIMKSQNMLSWAQAHPKTAWFLGILILSIIVDEIRVPLLRIALGYLGISF